MSVQQARSEHEAAHTTKQTQAPKHHREHLFDDLFGVPEARANYTSSP